jgi:hypothetical protein
MPKLTDAQMILWTRGLKLAAEGKPRPTDPYQQMGWDAGQKMLARGGY